MYHRDENEGHKKISYKRCPECQKPLFRAPRYQAVLKAAIKKVENLKKILEARNKELTERERRQVIAAASEDVARTSGTAAGHWFECDNGHPYLIGECGGAMQLGKCPECGVAIGGSSHRLVTGNRLATSVDGSTQPAYPTL